ncbi:MAG TPA: PhoU domain-containing protein [Candidatus Brocadiia bacterium]|nr:PhoU domain-containing protein [Candidatus Brocadiia bacterium]
MLLQEHLHSVGGKRLQELRDLLTQMANHIEFAMAGAVMGLVEQSADFTRSAVSEQARIDSLHEKVDNLAMDLLTSGHLSKRGIRFVAHALKIAMDFEQMEEEVRQIADSSMVMNAQNAGIASSRFPRLVENSQGMVADGIDAFVHCNKGEAEEILTRARELDVICQEVFREILSFIGGHPDAAGGAMHMLLVTRSFRRIGDAAANMARSVKAICLRCSKEQEKPA